MSHRTVKVLRLTCESRGRKIVGTVKHGFSIVIIKDPAGRRISPKIATLRVYPGAQFVSFKPHVRKVYLRQVNLQNGGSYDVRHGMTFSYCGHMWTVQFVDMIQRTRSHSQLRSVSSILKNIMTAYANALPDFICELTLHDPAFPDP